MGTEFSGNFCQARTSEGITPLYLALQKRQRDVAGLLVDRGAAVDAQTATGNSALHMAAQSGFLEEALLLLQSRCNVDARTVTGHTPLHLAATYCQHEMADMLLTRGRASVDAEDNTGRRSLHFAVQHGAHETVKVLLAHGSSVDKPSSRGLTPLDVAAYAAPPPGRPESLASMQALLSRGASVTSAHPWNGQTALHAAAFLRRQSVVDLLLGHGAVKDCRFWLQMGDGLREGSHELEEGSGGAEGCYLEAIGCQPNNLDAHLRLANVLAPNAATAAAQTLRTAWSLESRSLVRIYWVSFVRL